MRIAALALLSVLPLAAPSSVRAAVVPVYSSQASANARADAAVNNRSAFNQTVYADDRISSGALGSSATAHTELDATARPFVLSEARGSASSALASSLAQASARTLMQYEFRVLGPSATVPVTIVAKGDFLTSGMGSGNAGARIVADISFSFTGAMPGGGAYGVRDQAQIDYRNGVILGQILQGNATITGDAATGFTGTISEGATYSLVVGSIYRIGIFAEASGVTGGNGFLPGQAFSVRSFVDPYLSIASGTPGAALYSFEFPVGVGNQPGIGGAVPEPATWAMMLIGFAGLGFVSRRKAQAAAATA